MSAHDPMLVRIFREAQPSGRALFEAIWKEFVFRLACHRERRKLADMEAWQLKDLGLTREEALAESKRRLLSDYLGGF